MSPPHHHFVPMRHLSGDTPQCLAGTILLGDKKPCPPHHHPLRVSTPAGLMGGVLWPWAGWPVMAEPLLLSGGVPSAPSTPGGVKPSGSWGGRYLCWLQVNVPETRRVRGTESRGCQNDHRVELGTKDGLRHLTGRLGGKREG